MLAPVIREDSDSNPESLIESVCIDAVVFEKLEYNNQTEQIEWRGWNLTQLRRRFNEALVGKDKEYEAKISAFSSAHQNELGAKRLRTADMPDDTGRSVTPTADGTGNMMETDDLMSFTSPASKAN